MELLWDGGMKVCSNGPGHMTKMASMPKYGQNLKKSSSLEPKGWRPWNLVCIIGCSSTNEVKRFFLNLQQMTIVMRPSYWHQNFGPNGLSAPAQGLCLNFFSSLTTDFNISSALRWVIQAQWSSGYLILCKTGNEMNNGLGFACFNSCKK